MANILITIIASILFGGFVGGFIAFIIVYWKTRKQNKNVLKTNPNILEEIKSEKEVNKEIQNGRIKQIKDIKDRERNYGTNSDQRGSSTRNNNESRPTDNNDTNEESIRGRRGVQIPTSDFTLRD